jgi:hypothetical protein
MSRSFRSAIVTLLLPGLVLVDGCSPVLLKRESRPPDEVTAIPHRSSYLRAHLRDGSLITVTSWSVDRATRTVSGTGERFDSDRHPVAHGKLTFPMDSVAIYEAENTTDMPPEMQAITIVLVTVLAVAVVGLAVIAIACALDPKCFGSCPTFYAWDGDHMALQAEGFSASVAPSLEATDVDALYRAHPTGRDLDILMTNEALETHVVRSVCVLAVPRAAGTRVFAARDSVFWQVDTLLEPEVVVGDDGGVLDRVRRFDGVERTSLVDSTDLAARETLEVVFPPAPRGPVGLVVASRQTLLTTYLFYETLAAMGGSTGQWIAALERSDSTARQRVGAMGERLGGIDVAVAGPDGSWRDAVSYVETGPIAADVRVIPLPATGPGPVRVRLRMARGSTRLDWLALARLQRTVEPIRLQPVAVKHDRVADPEALARLRDPARALVTGPGDRYTLTYRLPGDPVGYELFLESRGYYLEWMRKPWIESENPNRLAEMMLNPARALRDLAPAYAREQAALESWFWSSRYAHP